MIDYSLLLAVLAGIVLLLLFILRFKLPAFLSLLIASIAVGIFAGVSAEQILQTLQSGMGGTLGFVAIVVGLGTLLGGILEHSGGAEAIAKHLLLLFGEKNTSWGLVIIGFIIAIPVFFDVAFILLVPFVYSLQRKTGKSILLYGLPLLAGLAITHAFIPPTPGPVAVADILSVNLGWVIAFGALVGIPTAIISGPLFAHYISQKIQVSAPMVENHQNKAVNQVPVGTVLGIIVLPLFLMVAQALIQSFSIQEHLPSFLNFSLQLMGHPFGALILANLMAWWLLGLHQGVDKKDLLALADRSMIPAGLIILLTGAGGTFKQMLITTQAGKVMAELFVDQGVPLLFFAFLSAVLLRLIQGSATVAMITAAGLTAPLLTSAWSEPQKALLVIAIASGASILSHVNDSGYWLVSKYLGLNESQTFRSWSIMTLLIAVVGFSCVCLLFPWV